MPFPAIPVLTLNKNKSASSGIAKSRIKTVIAPIEVGFNSCMYCFQVIYERAVISVLIASIKSSASLFFNASDGSNLIIFGFASPVKVF